MIGEITASEGSVRRHGHLKLAYYNQHSEAQLELALSPIQYMTKRFAKGVLLPGADKKCVPEFEQWRSVLGQYGITGARQMDPMSTMSNGLQTRVVFCILALERPHILLLDEPTNHLDMGASLVSICLRRRERRRAFVPRAPAPAQERVMLTSPPPSTRPCSHFPLPARTSSRSRSRSLSQHPAECIDSLANAIKNFSGGMVLVSHDFRLLGQVAEELWVCDNKTIKTWTKPGGIVSYKKQLRKDGEKALSDWAKSTGRK